MLSIRAFQHRAFQHLAAAAVFSLGACLPISAQSQQTAIVAQHVPSIISSGQAKMVGSADSSTHLKLALSLPLRNEASLDALLAQIYDPSSPNYHHYLSSEQFTAAYQPSQAEYDAVVAWAKSKGLQVTATSPNRHVVDVEGSIATITSAFHVLINSYRDENGRVFHAPDREPTFDSPVQLYAISGLDDATPRHPHYKKKPAVTEPKPEVNGCAAEQSATPNIKGSGPSNTYLPSDMRAAYYGASTLTGTGQTVGIFSYDGYLASDLSLFYSTTGTSSSVPVKNVLVNGYNGACFGFNSDGSENPNTCDDGEQILDIVQVTGMAPGLTQVLFYEGDSSTDILNNMASDNTAKTITSSWGGGDFGTVSDPIFKQFQTQGQSYLNATGDSGQFNSSTYDPPSVDANITQVGGTDLATSSAGGPWASETGWGCSGGGFQSGTAIPSYQQASGVITTANGGSTSYRNAPDLAAEADFDNSTVIDGSFATGYGGTSYATPRWAGYIALANQQSVANGNSTLGFLNPLLYTIGEGSSYHTDFHDITVGNNKPSAGSGSGFNATAGYDLITGWGSPNGAALINTLAGTKTANPDFSLATSPTSGSVVAGSSTTTKITVTDLNSFAGTVAFTASGLPTGVTASFSPTSSTTSTTLTLTTASTTAAGSSTITITGTSGSLTHTATFALTVTAAGGGATQLIVNPGFETGAATPWTLTSGVLCSSSTCPGQTAHSGTYFAWLNGYGTTHTDTASQKVVITAGKSTASLSFYLHIDTAETTKTTAYDKLTVQLLNSSGTVLTTLATFSNLNAASGYTVHTYNLAAYVGQTVTLKFTGTEDSSLQTSFVLDDTTLTVQ
jgi:subtilase family serine protease